MTLGGALYFATLVEYLTHFPGRFAAPVTAYGPPDPDWPRDRARLCQALGLTEPVGRGDRVRLTGEAGAAEGVVYFANAYTIGVRTDDALYRFMRGWGRPVIAAHELFAAHAEPGQAQPYWEAWLSRTLA
jgi:hypothetical protein